MRNILSFPQSMLIVDESKRRSGQSKALHDPCLAATAAIAASTTSTVYICRC